MAYQTMRLKITEANVMRVPVWERWGSSKRTRPGQEDIRIMYKGIEVGFEDGPTYSFKSMAKRQTRHMDGMLEGLTRKQAKNTKRKIANGSKRVNADVAWLPGRSSWDWWFIPGCSQPPHGDWCPCRLVPVDQVMPWYYVDDEVVVKAKLGERIPNHLTHVRIIQNNGTFF